MLSNEFVKLANSLKGPIKQRSLFRLVLKTVWKEKCAEIKLTRHVVEKIISFLRSDQMIQESHFILEKHALFRDYFGYTFTFTLAQIQVIADLSQMEVTEESVQQQLILLISAHIATLTFALWCFTTGRGKKAFPASQPVSRES